MGKKKKKSKAHQKQSIVFDVDINKELIEKKIVSGNSKLALDLAKQFHKTNHSDESELLLIYSYLSRIQSMSEKGLVQEADSLLDLVRQNFPQYQAQLEEMSLVIMIQSGCENNLIQLLKNVKTPEEKKLTLENLIRCEISDLSTIANCVALPQEYPIRKEAAILNEAFLSVTRVPVTDEVIALKEIPRRSPLSPWKMLINAIASFYREDDELCKKYLNMIDPKSAPARLIEPLLNMIVGQTDVSNRSSEMQLCSHICKKNDDGLEKHLKLLDRLFDSIGDANPEDIFKRFHSSLRYFKKNHPDIINNFNQILSIRFQIAEIPMNFIEMILDTKIIKDTFFYRHWARGIEAEGFLLGACCVWEGFRKQAIKEALFEADSPGEVTIFLYMTKLLGKLPLEDLEEARDDIRKSLSSDLPSEFDFFNQIREFISVDKKAKYDIPFLFPEWLFEKICSLDPDPEYFLQWHDYAKKINSAFKNQESILLAWHEALHQDIRPLLLLMKSSKKRLALKKSLNYLKLAESIDSYNPEIQQANLSLQIFMAFQHLKQRKAHLARKDIELIEVLPQMQSGDRRAILTALKWACSVIEDNSIDATKWFDETCKIFESITTATIIIREVGRSCSIIEKYLPKPKISEDIVHSIVRTDKLCKDIEVEVRIPANWEKYITKQLTLKARSFNLKDLLILGEAALSNGLDKLAYRISGIGLANRYDDARFLFIRAKCLPSFGYERADSCVSAVLWLAQKQRNLELLNEAIEWQRSNDNGNLFIRTIFGGFPNSETPSLDIEEVEDILEMERENTKFPNFSFNRNYDKRSLSKCNCPECRRERKEQEQSQRQEADRRKKAYQRSESDRQAAAKEQAEAKMRKREIEQEFKEKNKQLFLFDETEELED